MTWCHQATSHSSYLRQCWAKPMMLYGVTRPQWVNWLFYKKTAWQVVKDLGIHQICTKHTLWDTITWCWKWGPLTLFFKVILAILTKNSSKLVSAWHKRAQVLQAPWIALHLHPFQSVVSREYKKMHIWSKLGDSSSNPSLVITWTSQVCENF